MDEHIYGIKRTNMAEKPDWSANNGIHYSMIYITSSNLTQTYFFYHNVKFIPEIFQIIANTIFQSLFETLN